MNIPYEQIKAKAQDRERALRALEAHLAHLEKMSDRLLEDLAYFKALQEYLNAVDAEGQTLIPNLPSCIYRVTSVCARLHNDLHTNWSDSKVGVLTALRQAVSEP